MRKTANVYFLILITLSVLWCTVVSAEVVDRIVAIVNDEIVTLVDIQKGAAPYMNTILSAPGSDEQKEKAVQRLHNDILDRMIERSLTHQEAARYGISVPDADVDNALDNIRARKSLTLEEFEQALGYEGLTIDEFRDNIKKQILQSKIISVAVKSKVVITQSDIQAYYDANQEKYKGNKTHHLRNILMQEKGPMLKIKDRLDQGQSFIILAKQFSTAANAEDGGDLGSFDISGFSPEIKKNIAVLRKGQHTGVIETAQGYQIFYVEEIEVQGRQTLDQVSKEIEEALYQDAVDKKFRAWLDTLKEKAHIKKML